MTCVQKLIFYHLLPLYNFYAAKFSLQDDRKSVFAHMSSNNHNIAFDQASVVKFSNTSFNRTIIKSALIKYHSEKLYNIHPWQTKEYGSVCNILINF